MEIRNVSRNTLEAALATANGHFGGNLIWNDGPEPTNRKATNWRCTLRVKDSKGPGARRGFDGRRMINACWHAVGTFMDALPTGTVIITGGRTVRAGDPWQDWNVGSTYNPQFMSALCGCGEADEPAVESLPDLDSYDAGSLLRNERYVPRVAAQATPEQVSDALIRYQIEEGYPTDQSFGVKVDLSAGEVRSPLGGLLARITETGQPWTSNFGDVRVSFKANGVPAKRHRYERETKRRYAGVAFLSAGEGKGTLKPVAITMTQAEAYHWLDETGCDLGRGDAYADEACQFVIASGWEAVNRPEFMAAVQAFNPSRERAALSDLWGFADEYDTCSECGRTIRTSPDSYGWKADWYDSDDGRICQRCVAQDPTAYLTHLQDEAAAGRTAACNLIDPEEHGFVRVLEDLEHGLHDGQNDDPRKLIKWAREMPGADDGEPYVLLVFTVYPSQFSVTFDVWVKVWSAEGYRTPNAEEVRELQETLSVPTWGEHRTLRDTFKQWPTPAQNMKRALESVSGPGFRRINTDDGSVKSYGSLDEMVKDS